MPKTPASAAKSPPKAIGRPGRVPGGPVKYQQVADALRAAILSGALPPASPLPSETQLMAEHGISRPTARAAVAALKAEGLVTVLHGKGAFVRRNTDRPAHTHPRVIHTRPGPRGRIIYADADADGWREVDEPTRYATAATPELALSLGVAEHTPLVVYERLRGNDAGRRLAHRLYIPLVTLGRLSVDPDAHLTPGQVYTALARAGHPLAWTEHVRARMPAPDDATALRIPDGTPMLLTRRTTTDTTDGTALMIEETRVSADDAQLAYHLDATPSDTGATDEPPLTRTRPRRRTP